MSSTITHRITVFVNDEIVSSNQADPNVHSWAGNGMFNFSRNTSAFRPGTNRIKIRVLRTMPDNLFLDYIRVSYDKALVKGNAQYSVNGYGGVTARYNFSGSASNISVYRVADDYTVSVLPYETQGSGFSFVGQSNASTRYYLSRPEELLSPVLVQRVNPTNLAELGGAIQSVIVSPSEFFEKAQELAQMYQQNWGYSTKVVLQEDIFNQFNGGHPDPAAVRQYVRYLYHNAPAPKIQSLTLLGLGSLDWRNYSRSAANQNRIMIYQHPNTTPPNVSDDYYAMITTNTYPEIAVGRYPVSNMNELNNMLNNFRRYTQNPKPGLWRNSMVFLADDFVNGDTTTDWQHTRDMQALANTLNPAVYNEKIFAQEWDYDEFFEQTQSAGRALQPDQSGQVSLVLRWPWLFRCPWHAKLLHWCHGYGSLPKSGYATALHHSLL
ncbi:MAG: C25 family cysteine peptidase [Candidatus Cloacimonetes bacterium]|nr:C25 family cysteine peptidase [Candidatus Cloacimonadota bacterium]